MTDQLIIQIDPSPFALGRLPAANKPLRRCLARDELGWSLSWVGESGLEWAVQAVLTQSLMP
jgi:hypothetical protein